MRLRSPHVPLRHRYRMGLLMVIGLGTIATGLLACGPFWPGCGATA